MVARCRLSRCRSTDRSAYGIPAACSAVTIRRADSPMPSSPRRNPTTLTPGSGRPDDGRGVRVARTAASTTASAYPSPTACLVTHATNAAVSAPGTCGNARTRSGRTDRSAVRYRPGPPSDAGAVSQSSRSSRAGSANGSGASGPAAAYTARSGASTGVPSEVVAGSQSPEPTGASVSRTASSATRLARAGCSLSRARGSPGSPASSSHGSRGSRPDRSSATTCCPSSVREPSPCRTRSGLRFHDDRSVLGPCTVPCAVVAAARSNQRASSPATAQRSTRSARSARRATRCGV